MLGSKVGLTPRNCACASMEYLSEIIHIPDWNNRYFLVTRVGVFVGIYQAWFAGGKQETAEELISIMSHQTIVVKNSGFVF